MASRVLIVDDDPIQCRLLEEMVRALGHACESVQSGEAALARLGACNAPPIAAMILDLVMPDLDGMAVLERLGRRALWLPVIVETAGGGVDAATSAMRSGAFDFVVKPVAPERIRVSLANALKVAALAGEVSRMSRSRAGTLEFADIVMRSAPMERVRDLGRRAARSSVPILIEGETGTGKEIFARAIHGSSARRARPFVSVNCAAIARDTAEAVLFGEANSAGANPGKSGGKLREAQGGTLFLDEVGALPSAAQRRLLEIVQAGASGPSRSGRVPRSDIRLIVATRRRLVDLVTEGSFREDVFYALGTFPIWLPPLRERRSDIAELARILLTRLAAEAGRPDITGLTPEAVALLSAHDWPGNIGQLESAIFRAIALCDGGEVAPRDFPQILAGAGENGSSNDSVYAASSIVAGAPSGVADEKQLAGERLPHSVPLPDRVGAARYGTAKLLDERGELRRFEVLEEEVIRFAVDHYRGHMSEVARRLGIGRSTLYRKLRDYGIAPSEATAP